jgi:histidinol-phosphate phosphatase family protein
VKQVVILAGGKGTRLQERLAGRPKPLIDICGKPLLERQIELIKRHGYTHVLLLVNFNSNQIVDFCRSRNNWKLSIEFIDDGEPLGTAGATLAIFDRLAEDFLVLYGDTMLEVDLTRFHVFHRLRTDVAATLFLHPNDHPFDSDLVEVNDEMRVTAFHSYPHKEGFFHPNLVNAALYYVKRSALAVWRGTPGILDFSKDIFPAMLKQGQLLQGYNSPEYIKDCGTPIRLDKICADFESGQILGASYNIKQKAVFLDRDGTINREVGHISEIQQLELLPDVGGAIKRLNSAAYRTVLVTNQPVIARGDCSDIGLKLIHNKLETLLGHDGGYLDRIYYCPHHPERGFQGENADLKIDCNCRKPGTAMIDRASKELNIDITRSWLVGDTTVDLMTAHSAGIRSILVETGYAGNDQGYWVDPDFIVPDLPAAVDFILNDHPRLIDICCKAAKEICEGDFIFIGGLSCSGKSNFTSCLKESLIQKGLGVSVLCLDRWLRNSSGRLEGVLGRYALDEIRLMLSLLERRSKSIALKLPVYNRIQRQRVQNSDSILIGQKDVVIVEGVVALTLLDVFPNDSVHPWFIDIKEEERHKRILKKYQQQGLDRKEAEKMYQKRQGDEIPLVLAASQHATQRFNLELP